MERLLGNITGGIETPTAYARTSARSADWTDRPLPQNLAARLRDRVIGQDEAVTAVVETIELRALGLELGRRRPLAFLFCGPTGVGKTELAMGLARELFQRQERLLRFDCSEFTEPHQVARLMGAPPGYVGYGTRSTLDEFLSGGRGGILLLDEFEKANAVFHRLFLQVLDDGRLGDSAGRTLDLSGLVVIATTNAGLRERTMVGFHGTRTVSEDEATIASFRDVFAIELLNRFDSIIRFKHLSREVTRRIVREHLVAEAARMLKTRHGVRLEVTEAALALVIEAGYARQLGARNLHRSFSRMVLHPIARILGERSVNGCVVVDAADGCIVISETTEALA